MSMIHDIGPRQVLHGDMRQGGVGPMEKPIGKPLGREVEALPKHPTIKPPTTTTPQQVSGKPKLEQRTVQQDKPPHALVRKARYGALDTRDDLIKKAGRPKEDKNFGFFGTKKMSTGYKAILGGLENYKNETSRAGGRQESPTQRLQGLKAKLGEIDSSVDTYMGIKKHGRKQEIGGIKEQVRRETEVIDKLIDEISKGTEFP